MDIEQIKKINEMSKALKEHGLDENPGHNPDVARELERGHMSDPNQNQMNQEPQKIMESSPVQNSSQEVPQQTSEPVQEQSTSYETSETTSNDNLATKDFVKEQISNNNENFIQAIEMLKKNIREVNQKVEDVTKEFIAYRKRMDKQLSEQAPAQSATPAKTEQESVQEKRAENKSMTNNEDFNDDVSVEKFFYYGKK